MTSLKELYERRKKLAEFTPLSGVSEEFLWELAEACEKLHRRRNEIIYSFGDASDSVYLIVKGEVQVEKKLQQQREQEATIITFDKKYSNNGIKIRSYHGLHQPLPILLVFGQGDVLGYDQPESKLEVHPQRRQQAKCRTVCDLYRVPLDQFKSVVSTVKGTQAAFGRHALAEKNFSLGRLQDALPDKKLVPVNTRNRDRLVRISLCKYNKLNNIPLELSAQSRTLQTKQGHRMNKSSIEHYEPRKKEISSSSKPKRPTLLLNEENNFVNCLLQARAKKLVRAKYLFQEETPQMKFQDRLRPKKLL